ncbi:cell division protein FtsQ/DivIB [Candidatus Omnitrophota bacterium]
MDKKNKKTKTPKKNIPIRKIAAVIIFKIFLPAALITALALLIFGVKRYFLESGYFNVRVIEVQGEKALNAFNKSGLLHRFRDKNIFVIDLEDTERFLRASCADIGHAAVRKVLPDTLSVLITVREPVALVKGRKYIPVDRDGVLLMNIKTSGWKKLPVIEGVRLKARELKDKVCASRNIKSALSLIEAIHASGILTEHDVNRVNASDHRNLVFFMDDGIEIRIRAEDMAGQLSMLKEILKDPKISPDEIRYIDLRFEDGVIGPK